MQMFPFEMACSETRCNEMVQMRSYQLEARSTSAGAVKMLVLLEAHWAFRGRLFGWSTNLPQSSPNCQHRRTPQSRKIVTALLVASFSRFWLSLSVALDAQGERDALRPFSWQMFGPLADYVLQHVLISCFDLANGVVDASCSGLSLSDFDRTHHYGGPSNSAVHNMLRPLRPPSESDHQRAYSQRGTGRMSAIV